MRRTGADRPRSLSGVGGVLAAALAAAVGLIGALAPSSAAAQQSFGPWPRATPEFPAWATPAASAERAPVRSGLLVTGIRLYQRNLSPLKGFHCPSWPSCSSFALRWLLMTLDRLFIREHRRMGDFYPLVRLPDGVRFYDPPSHNDLVTKLPPFRPFHTVPR